MATTLTWLGHAAFRMDTPSGKRIYVDPFLTGNPKCPESEREPERVDTIYITHGHNDHVGDTLDLYKKFQCPVIAPVEVRDLLGMMGCETEGPHDPNKGGTVELDGVKAPFWRADKRVLAVGGLLHDGSEGAPRATRVLNGKAWFPGPLRHVPYP